ncbi:metallophosphoesterase family protein [Paenibacillus lutrae]|uniref:DNA repair exonuclease n=1 Tax=Paenibacillus lutrae TaxID=2078573 RepID=A0A7X3FF60_9BACL|nr:DNA repair exonuclease [Paenibacillus lutrae]MVO98556.1 DNA repair exonuclease [Paenibacillus lutrae]
MKPLKFMHAADLHLDSAFKGMHTVPGPIREVIRESTFTALGRLVRLAIRENVDFVVFSGDIYDTADRSLRAQLRFRSALAELDKAGIPSFVIHGNHDPADGRAARLDWPPSVHVYAAGGTVETVPVFKEDRGTIAHVHGISYPTAAVLDNYALRFNGKDASVYQIALLHTNVDGNPGFDNYAPCSRQDLIGRGIDYWALGHIHTREVLNESPLAVYPGNIQGRSIRECGERGCYIVHVDEHGCAQLAFHTLDAVRWEQADLSIEGITTEQELHEGLDGLLDELRAGAGGRPVIVRLALTGRGPLHLRLQSGSTLTDLVRELRDSEAAKFGAGSLSTGSDREQEQSGYSEDKYREGYGSGETFSVHRGNRQESHPPFVWVESIESHTGQDLDLDQLLTEESFMGDLLRLAEELAADEKKLEAFAAEALHPLMSQPGAAKLFGGRAAEDELQEWLRAARELALDLLVAGGGRER